MVKLDTLAASIIFATALALGCTSAGAATVVTVRPSAARIEVRTKSPGPGHVWVGGHWRWKGSRHVWVAGGWVVKPRPHAVWVSGHWKHKGRGWVWVPGHWR